MKETEVSLYLNDELIHMVELPHYQSMCSVVTDTEDEVMVKIVNFSEEKDAVEIHLDCDVASEYIASVLTGAADAENTLEEPEHVQDITMAMKGAGRDFVFNASGLSVNVLRLKKSSK